MKYVIVDWRPYEIPDVIGPFATEQDAERRARKLYEIDTDDQDLPDGIDIVPLQYP